MLFYTHYNDWTFTWYVKKNSINLNIHLLSNTMCRCQNILLRQQRRPTVELAIIDQPRHPWIPVKASRNTTYYAIFLVRPTAFYRESDG